MSELGKLISKNAENFEQTFNYEPALTAVAPGRINIIGEHTDYNGGLSLATAVNRWVLVSVAKRSDQTVIARSGNYNSTISFQIGELLGGDDKWHLILSGIVNILKEEYGIKNGFEAYIWGNVPLGSGVSSSAAIEVALLNALRALYQLTFSDTQIVLHSQETEHKYMKVKSGLLDQYTSQFSLKKNFVLIDLQTVSHRYIPSDIKGYQWVLVNTMVKRELSGSKYSERVEETQLAFQSIKNEYKEVKHFRDIQLKHIEVIEDSDQRKRILHYLEENNRVNSFVQALLINDVKKAGELLSASHRSLKEKYEVSCVELDFLAEKAILITGCLGSRMMGGGFGGCTINLVKEDEVENFCKQISGLYKLKFEIEPEINIYETVGGATIEDLYSDKIEKTKR
jgi:galactokinase